MDSIAVKLETSKHDFSVLLQDTMKKTRERLQGPSDNGKWIPERSSGSSTNAYLRCLEEELNPLDQGVCLG